MRINDVYKEAERRVPDVSAAVKQRIATTDGAKKPRKSLFLISFLQSERLLPRSRSFLPSLSPWY